MNEIREEKFLNHIGREKFKRKDIAITYSFCLDNPNINWDKINKAIIDRWSLSGLKYIKKEAWKIYNKYEKQEGGGEVK